MDSKPDDDALHDVDTITAPLCLDNVEMCDTESKPTQDISGHQNTTSVIGRECGSFILIIPHNTPSYRNGNSVYCTSTKHLPPSAI